MDGHDAEPEDEARPMEEQQGPAVLDADEQQGDAGHEEHAREDDEERPEQPEDHWRRYFAPVGGCSGVVAAKSVESDSELHGDVRHQLYSEEDVELEQRSDANDRQAFGREQDKQERTGHRRQACVALNASILALSNCLQLTLAERRRLLCSMRAR